MDRKEFIRKSGCGMLCAAAAPLFVQNATAQYQPVENIKNTNAMKHKCKITVLRREFFQDLAKEYLANPAAGKCNLFDDGQEFILEQGDFFHLMDGKFCSEAWDAISRYVYAALQGGSIMRGWTKDEKVMISCCSDGVRPVIFKIERIDEE
jgi:uncharacterized repeat protein (TIGR04076 family)